MIRLPLTAIVWPSMKLDLSLRKKHAASAISSGLARGRNAATDESITIRPNLRRTMSSLTAYTHTEGAVEVDVDHLVPAFPGQLVVICSLCVPVHSQCMTKRPLPNRPPPRKKSSSLWTLVDAQNPIPITTAK